MLGAIGLKKPEKQVYLALLPMGAMTVTPLSRAVQLPVTTVQSILSRLLQKGLIDSTKRKTRHVYEARDPQVLRKQLEQRLEEVKQVIPFLQELKTDAGSQVRVRVYERERMADMFHDILTAKDETIYEIVAAKDLQLILGEKFHFTRRRVAKGKRLKSLRVETQEVKTYSINTHKKELREAKFLPRECTFAASMFLWDDSIAIFSAKHEGLGVIITSKSIHAMAQQFFDVLWEISRRMVTDQ